MGPEKKAQVNIRSIKREDIDAILRIERASFPAPWSKQMFLNELSDPTFSFFLVAEEDGEVTGYAGFWLIIDEVHIGNLAIREDRRRRGTGRALLDALLRAAREQNARTATLEVRSSNNPAIALYHSFGFTRVGLRRGYYQDNREDAVLMTAQLDTDTDDDNL